jgi:hypothetical protein
MVVLRGKVGGKGQRFWTSMDQTFHAGQYLFHYLGTYISSSCVRLVLQSGLWLRLDSSYRGFESHNKGWKGICYIEINRLYVG